MSGAKTWPPGEGEPGLKPQVPQLDTLSIVV
jgi:hypothetical protein